MKIADDDISSYRRSGNRKPKGGGGSRTALLLGTFVVLSLVVVFALLEGGYILPNLGQSQPAATASENQEPEVTVGDLSESQDQIAGSLEELAEQVKFLVGANDRDNAQFRKVAQSLKNLEKNLNTYSDNIAKIDSRLQVEISKRDERINLVQKLVEDLRADMDKLGNSVNSQADGLKEVTEFLENINARVISLER